MPEVIKLKPLTSWEKAQRKRAKLPAPLRVLTSLKTTAVLGATLGAMLSPATALKSVTGLGKVAKFVAPKTLKGAIGMAIGVPTAYGVLKSSAKARTFAKKALDPREAVKRGEYVGGMIEDPKKLKRKAEEKGWKKTIKEAGIEGGKYGLLGAGVLGAGVLGKKYLEKRKLKKELVKDVGIVEKSLPFVPSGLAHPYAPQTALPSPQIMPIGRPKATQMPKPITNIIQIQLR